MTDTKKDPLAGVEFIPPPSKAGKQAKDKETTTKASGGKKGGLTIVQLENGLRANFEMLGIAVMGLDKFDGTVIVEKADELASALTELAKNNPRVRSVLESLMEVGAWGGVISVIGLQVALPIAVHHNLLPDDINRMLATQGDIPIKGQDKGETKENVTHITVSPDGDPAS